MKYIITVLSVVGLLLTSCVYEAPLTEEHTIAIDPTLLGLWEFVPNEGETVDPFSMMILKLSDTEYLIHYAINSDETSWRGDPIETYWRGYPIKIGDISCVQLQQLGTCDGPLKKDETKRYQVASYQLVKGKLQMKVLNSDAVDYELKTTEELVKAFIEYKDDEELWIDAVGLFKRNQKES